VKSFPERKRFEYSTATLNKARESTQKEPTEKMRRALTLVVGLIVFAQVNAARAADTCGPES